MTELPVTLAEAAAALRSGELTSVELTTAVSARADVVDPVLGVYLARCDDAALAAAHRADDDLRAGRDRGPLHGIPLAVKDLIRTADCPTTAQSRVLDPAWGERGDAPVVTRLREAGAVITGKTSLMEYAVGLADPAMPFPLPRNPWDPTRWPGGSSSGAAAGVAAGLFYGCVATDTAGSIRLPAALCGVTGLKPTFGRVPKVGVVPLAWSCDHVGPIARTARDCAVMLQALAGHDAEDPWSVEAPVPDYEAALVGHAEGLRIGVLREHHLDHPYADPMAVTAFEAAVDDLRATGAQVEDVAIPDFDLLFDVNNVVFLSEAFAYHRSTLRTQWGDYGGPTRAILAAGLFYSGPDYVQATRLRRHLRERVAAVMEDVDVIATPTTLAGAPPVGFDFAAALGVPMFTSSWDALGVPTASVPCGVTATGAPLGLQLAGRGMEEATVLRVADAYQQVTDWHRRLPAIR